MEIEQQKSFQDKILTKFNIFIQEIWPGVYRNINEGLAGVIQFIKDTISSIWRRY